MASITGYGSKHSHEFVLTVSETGTNVANNTSDVSFTFTCYKSSYSWSGISTVTYSININGNTYTGNISSYSAGSTLTIRSGSLTIPHNTDGSKSISFSFSVTDNSGRSYCPGNASASGSMALSNIPRYTSVSISQRSKSWNSITINWSAADATSAREYRLNGGAWKSAGGTVNSGSKSGYFTISNLNQNTYYKIEVQVRRSDSGLWSTSNSLGITTDKATISLSCENINYGDNAIVNLTNPANLATSLVGKIDSKEIIPSRSISTGANTINFTEDQLLEIYKSYGDISLTNSINLTFTATASNGQSATKTISITYTGNRATIWIKENGTWKKGIAWIKQNGVWKKGITWKGDNGKWTKAQ